MLSFDQSIDKAMGICISDPQCGMQKEWKRNTRSVTRANKQANDTDVESISTAKWKDYRVIHHIILSVYWGNIVSMLILICECVYLFCSIFSLLSPSLLVMYVSFVTIQHYWWMPAISLFSYPSKSRVHFTIIDFHTKYLVWRRYHCASFASYYRLCKCSSMRVWVCVVFTADIDKPNRILLFFSSPFFSSIVVGVDIVIAKAVDDFEDCIKFHVRLYYCYYCYMRDINAVWRCVCLCVYASLLFIQMLWLFSVLLHSPSIKRSEPSQSIAHPPTTAQRWWFHSSAAHIQSLLCI